MTQTKDPLEFARWFIRTLVLQGCRSALFPPNPAFWQGPTGQKIIGQALSSWDRAARLIEHFTSTGLSLPPVLADFLVKVLKGKLTRPVRKGRPKESFYQTDLFLLADLLAQDFGLYRYRNEVTDPDPRRYVCDCISQVWEEETGEYISPETLSKALDRR